LFYLLGDYLELHRSCQLDHRRNHFLVDQVSLKIFSIGAIYLQLVNWQVLETRE
jgi:hypothetical protein